MKIGAIIQARMGSTRLPGKVLMPIAGKPLLEHVIGRLGMLRAPILTIVATSTESPDDVIATWCDHRRINCFRGAESDVLDRYLRCAMQFKLDQIVRLTADNPFTDMVELDRLIALHLHDNNDYTHSFGMMPLGVGAEIMSMSALAKSASAGLELHHREHVNEYIQEHPEIFRSGVLAVPAAKRAPELRMTVDTLDDYQHACRLAALCVPDWLDTERAIAAC